jgi:hypothetical protein
LNTKVKRGGKKSFVQAGGIAILFSGIAQVKNREYLTHLSKGPASFPMGSSSSSIMGSKSSIHLVLGFNLVRVRRDTVHWS